MIFGGLHNEQRFKRFICSVTRSFDENGQVNEQGLKQIAQNAIETEELDGLYVNGSSGENFY